MTIQNQRAQLTKPTTLAFLGGFILLLTFFFDEALLRRSEHVRFNALDGIMLFITDFGLAYLTTVLVVMLILQKKWRLLALTTLASILSFEITYLLKLLFQTPRPYLSLEVIITPLTQAAGFAFPSGHATFCFTLIAFLGYFFQKKWLRYVVGLLLATIAFSRTYLGVHYFSDLIAGALIGYFSAVLILFLEKKYQLINWFLNHIRDQLELRRQITHLITGLLIVFLLKLGLINTPIFLSLIILTAIFSVLQKNFQFKKIHRFLTLFEREHDLKNFPAKGPFFMLLGSFLAYQFFPLDIALAAISVLAVGDSISHLFGRYLGKIIIPPVQHKKLEGTLVAIACSTLTALLFVSFDRALIASSAILLLEYFLPPKLTRIIDDNLIIPVLSGVIISVLI